jgi:hypothetical protein
LELERFSNALDSVNNVSDKLIEKVGDPEAWEAGKQEMSKVVDRVALILINLRARPRFRAATTAMAHLGSDLRGFLAHVTVGKDGHVRLSPDSHVEEGQEKGEERKTRTSRHLLGLDGLRTEAALARQVLVREAALYVLASLREPAERYAKDASLRGNLARLSGLVGGLLETVRGREEDHVFQGVKALLAEMADRERELSGEDLEQRMKVLEMGLRRVFVLGNPASEEKEGNEEEESPRSE